MASSMVIQTCSNTAIFSRGVWKAAYGDTKTVPFDTVCEEPNICLCLLCHVFRNSVETTIVSPGNARRMSCQEHESRSDPPALHQSQSRCRSAGYISEGCAKTSFQGCLPSLRD